MTNELRELYKQSLTKKWDLIIETYKDEPDVADGLIGDFCPFCYDVKKQNPDISVFCDGQWCASICKIDKKICGSPTSLVNQLDREKIGEKVWEKTIRKVYRKLKWKSRGF